MNDTAEALGRAILGQADFGSSASDVSEASNQKAQEKDKNYSSPSDEETGEALSITSMKKILELRAKRRSHEAIKNIYPKYRSGKLEHYANLVLQGEPLVSRIRTVND